MVVLDTGHTAGVFLYYRTTDPTNTKTCSLTSQ